MEQISTTNYRRKFIPGRGAKLSKIIFEFDWIYLIGFVVLTIILYCFFPDMEDLTSNIVYFSYNSLILFTDEIILRKKINRAPNAFFALLSLYTYGKDPPFQIKAKRVFGLFFLCYFCGYQCSLNKWSLCNWGRNFSLCYWVKISSICSCGPSLEVL